MIAACCSQGVFAHASTSGMYMVFLSSSGIVSDELSLMSGGAGAGAAVLCTKGAAVRARAVGKFHLSDARSGVVCSVVTLGVFASGFCCVWRICKLSVELALHQPGVWRQHVQASWGETTTCRALLRRACIGVGRAMQLALPSKLAFRVRTEFIQKWSCFFGGRASVVSCLSAATSGVANLLAK